MAVVSAALEKRRAGKLARVGVKDVTQHDQPLTAAAALIPLDGTGWKTFKLGDAKWQRDAWHQYDINGDLRTIGNWIGKACSRARLYLAKVDATGRPGEEVTDPKLQIIAETMFGSPSAKAEAQRLLGIHLFVPGESFIVAEAAENAKEDRWYVVSTSDIRREGERTITVKRPQQFGGGEYTLKNGTDLLIRCWTPHPDKYDLADSSVRPGLIPLRLIEQLTKMEFAEVDSRLAGAGMLFVPEEMDFPTQGKEKNDATGLSSALTRTMSAAMTNREDASSMVPIVVQVPGELIGQIQHITFYGELQQHLAERMDQAVNRLARTLEIEPEILTGKADMNHWSAWQVDESTISIHVTPLLSRMCDALTAGYVRAALQVLGEDPDAYVLWYDTSMLTVEPDRQKDGLEMWDKGLISSDAVRKAGSWGEGDKPDDEEEARRIALHLVDLDPSKIEWEDIRKAIGGKVAAWKPPEPEPAPGADMANGPAGASQADAPGGGSPNPDNVRRLPQRPAQSESRQAAALRVGAHMAVQRALELVGKRLLTRPYRDRYADVPAHELHTRIRVGDPNRVNELLASADGPAVDLAMLAEAADLPEMEVATLLSAYCGELVQSGVRHNADLLGIYMAAGLHADCDEVCYAPAHPGRCDDDARMQFHLPGRHNQKTHGHRVGKPRVHGDVPGTGPFTEAEKIRRAGQRRGRNDPDRDAPAPDRQGKRAFADWELEAGNLSKQAQAVLAEADANERTRIEELERAALKKREQARAKRANDIAMGREREQDLQTEWLDVERELRNGFDESLTEALTKAVTKKSDVLSWEEADAVRQRVTKRHDRRVEEARRRHFEGNPTVLTDVMVWHEDAGGMGPAVSSYWARITDDTGFDFGAGIPIRNVSVQNHTFKSGWAYKSKGVVYVVEGVKRHDIPGLDPDQIDQVVAGQVAQNMERMADEVLPEGWRESGGTRAIGWSAAENGRALASANLGGGSVVFWNRHGKGRDKFNSALPTPADNDTLKHEWGHNSDKYDSTSKDWGAAQTQDANPGFRVEGFRQRSTQLHPINFNVMNGEKVPTGVTTYGATAPYEDFAESTELYLSGVIGTGRLRGDKEPGVIPIYFRDLFPARAKYLDGKHKAFAREQKAKIKAERAEQTRSAPTRDARRPFRPQAQS